MDFGLNTIEGILPSGRIGKVVREVKKVMRKGGQKGGNGGGEIINDGGLKGSGAGITPKMP